MGELNPGERFEWLQTWVDPSLSESIIDDQAQLARRCPRCAWLDAITEPDCFRCGFDFIAEIAGQDQEAAIPSPPERSAVKVIPRPAPISIKFMPPEELFQSQNDHPAFFHLRRRTIERSLIPGFERLLSLSEVNRELFQNYDHQQDVALKALRDMGGIALLADETGLGKTIEAGLIVKELMIRGLIQSLIIVVPASLTIQWQEELHEKLAIDAVIVRNFKDWIDEPKIVLCSYATIRGKGVGKHLRERPWDLLICDEAHYLKNRATKQYKAVNRITRKYILLLSATPFHNKLIELKNVLDLLKPGLFGSTRAFNKQYVDASDTRRPINVHHLKTILSEVMIRNRRSKVLITLPPRRACIVHLELNKEERTFYDNVSRFISKEVRHLLGRFKSNKFFRPGKLASTAAANRRGAKSYSYMLALISLQRETCSSPAAVHKTLVKMSNDLDHPAEVRKHLVTLAQQANELGDSRKTAAVFEILERFEGKLVIFCEFLATIDDLTAKIRAKGISVLKFDGRMSATQKQSAIKNFRGEARVLIASRAGGEGLNIQFCQNMVNYDLPWNPMSVEQRIGRLHRLGQEGDVNVFNLSVKDTIEARVLELLTNKIQLFSTVIGEIDLILGKLSDNQSFEQMLRDSWIQSQASGEDTEFAKLGDEIGEARKAYEELQENAQVMDSVSS
jgi:SNF2 family DNA or RNA helicase